MIWFIKKNSEYCDKKIHLYYFHHFIHNLVTRLCYFVTCLISNSILISILYIVFIYMSYLHICSLHYSLSTCLLSSQSFHSRLHLLSLQCTYSSFSYIFINVVAIHIQYHLHHSSYCIQQFVFDCYIQYLLLLLMRSFIIFHIWLLYSIFSIIFTLICTWHFLYIDIWLSFSWSAHFDRAYSKVLNTSQTSSTTEWNKNNKIIWIWQTKSWQ